jgi:AcrR family transcriptional regulator
VITPGRPCAHQDPCLPDRNGDPDLASAPSRRRSQQSHQAVLQATVALLNEVGYRRLSFEGVARRAGVGKATIYRWWPNKAALVIEALNGEVPLRPLPDTGDLEADLRTAIRLTVEITSAMPTCLILPALIADMIEDPSGTGPFAELISPHRASVVKLLDKARAQGRLPPETDTALMVDLYAGTVVYRATVSREPLDDVAIDQIVNLLLHGCIPTRPPFPNDAG